MNSLLELLAILRAKATIYQNNHWVSDQYDHHLLFERLYDDTLESMDMMAEKFIGVFGKEAFDEQFLLEKSCSHTAANILSKDFVQRAISLEGVYRENINQALVELSSCNKLTFGIETFLGDEYSASEKSTYLLNTTASSVEPSICVIDLTSSESNSILTKVADIQKGEYISDGLFGIPVGEKFEIIDVRVTQPDDVGITIRYNGSQENYSVDSTEWQPKSF